MQRHNKIGENNEDKRYRECRVWWQRHIAYRWRFLLI